MSRFHLQADSFQVMMENESNRGENKNDVGFLYGISNALRAKMLAKKQY